jgi:hypothetical protein
MADPKPNHSRLTTSRLAHEAEGGALGALAGTALGSLAGPPGMVVGALIGAIAGVLSGSAIDGNARREAVRKRALAAELGIEGREPGGPDVVRSPGVRRVYSAASLGVGILRERAPTEGPSQYPYD